MNSRPCGPDEESPLLSAYADQRKAAASPNQLAVFKALLCIVAVLAGAILVPLYLSRSSRRHQIRNMLDVRAAVPSAEAGSWPWDRPTHTVSSRMINREQGTPSSVTPTPPWSLPNAEEIQEQTQSDQEAEAEAESRILRADEEAEAESRAKLLHARIEHRRKLRGEVRRLLKLVSRFHRTIAKVMAAQGPLQDPVQLKKQVHKLVDTGLVHAFWETNASLQDKVMPFIRATTDRFVEAHALEATATDTYSEESWTDGQGKSHRKVKMCKGSDCKTTETITGKEGEASTKAIETPDSDKLASSDGNKQVSELLHVMAHEFQQVFLRFGSSDFQQILDDLYRSLGLRPPIAGKHEARHRPDILRDWSALPWSAFDNFANEDDLVDDVMRDIDMTPMSFGSMFRNMSNAMASLGSKLDHNMSDAFGPGASPLAETPQPPLDGLPNVDRYMRNVTMTGPRESNLISSGSRKSRGWSTMESSRSFYKNGKLHSESTQTYTGEDGKMHRRVTECDGHDCHSTDNVMEGVDTRSSNLTLRPDGVAVAQPIAEAQTPFGGGIVLVQPTQQQSWPNFGF